MYIWTVWKKVTYSRGIIEDDNLQNYGDAIAGLHDMISRFSLKSQSIDLIWSFFTLDIVISTPQYSLSYERNRIAIVSESEGRAKKNSRSGTR